MNLPLSIGYKPLIKTALPVFIGMLVNTIVGMVDTVLVGRLGSHQQSAVGYAALFYTVLFVSGFGFSLAVQIRMANRRGAENYKLVGAYFYTGATSLVILGLFMAFLWHFFSYPFFSLITQSQEIARFSANYFTWRSPALPFTMFNLAAMAYFIAIGKSLPVALANLFGGVINLALDFGLIFGNFGLPQMGLEGAALASFIADLFASIIYLFFLKRNIQNNPYFQLKYFFSTYLLKDIIQLGFPLWIQNILAIFSWFVFFTWIEKRGDLFFNISIIARNIYALFLMGGFAVGSTCNANVAALLGADLKNKIPLLLKRSMIISALFSIPAATLLIVFGKYIMAVFSSSNEVVNGANQTLQIIALALLVFSLSQILFSAVSGTGNTLKALKIEAFCITVYLLYTFYTIFISQNPSLLSIWAAEPIYMSLLGMLSFFFLRNFLKPTR
jgi:MATE family multidrug resistance protein